MRRALALLLSFAMVSSMVATPVAAHGSHVRADPQVSDDGTVVVETVSTVDGGYLVVHLVQADRPGRPVAVTELSSGTYWNVEMQIDREYWDQHEGNRTYAVVLHRDADQDDGGFDPAVDTPVRGIHMGPVSARVPVQKSADGSARVLAGELTTQDVDSPSVTLSRVQLDRPGHVVIQTVDQGAPGEIVGSRALEPGTYDELSVDIDQSVLDAMNYDGTDSLAATLHTSDGDGSFQPESDTVLRVDGEAVRTHFSITKVENASAPTEPLINTPERTSQATPVSTGGAGTTDADGDASTGSTAGFGVVAALVGTLLAALAVRRRGR